jgi:hypothetical protein
MKAVHLGGIGTPIIFSTFMILGGDKKRVNEDQENHQAIIGPRSPGAKDPGLRGRSPFGAGQTDALRYAASAPGCPDGP